LVKLLCSAALALGALPASAEAQTSPTWWKPGRDTTWQWQLTGKLNLTYNVKVYDVDLFDTPASTITALHNAGRKVVCYFSAGSRENWRPDSSKFLASDLGSYLDGWAGERWLKITSTNVRNIMKARLDLAAAKGCDGVEPDNVDGYTNDNGLGLTAAQQLDYNRFIATNAHMRNLAVGLKNDVDQISQLASYFDFAVNEQCHQYSECGDYSYFTKAMKPVFNAEYARKYKNNTNDARTKLCASSRANYLQTLILPIDLDGSFRISC
jgi:hypothetical protein